MTNPFPPQPYAGGQPFSPPPGGQAPPPRPGGRVAVLVAGAVALVAATAGITYAVTRTGGDANTSANGSAHVANSDGGAAKKRVCDELEVLTRGSWGDLRLPDNQVNVPVVLRILTGVVAIQDALRPDVPGDIDKAARDYVHSALPLMNAINTRSNEALVAFLDVCGIAH